jgi:hypothetical protein
VRGAAQRRGEISVNFKWRAGAHVLGAPRERHSVTVWCATGSHSLRAERVSSTSGAPAETPACFDSGRPLLSRQAIRSSTLSILAHSDVGRVDQQGALQLCVVRSDICTRTRAEGSAPCVRAGRRRACGAPVSDRARRGATHPRCASAIRGRSCCARPAGPRRCSWARASPERGSRGRGSVSGSQKVVG